MAAQALLKVYVSNLVYWGERSEPCTSEVNANSVCMYVID